MSTQPDEQKGPIAKMRKKKKKKKTLKTFSSLVSLTQHFTKFIFLEQLTAMPQFNMQNMSLNGDVPVRVLSERLLKLESL